MERLYLLRQHNGRAVFGTTKGHPKRIFHAQWWFPLLPNRVTPQYLGANLIYHLGQSVRHRDIGLTTQLYKTPGVARYE